jgi:hypothetical protein
MSPPSKHKDSATRNAARLEQKHRYAHSERYVASNNLELKLMVILGERQLGQFKIVQHISAEMVAVVPQ